MKLLLVFKPKDNDAVLSYFYIKFSPLYVGTINFYMELFTSSLFILSLSNLDILMKEECFYSGS